MSIKHRYKSLLERLLPTKTALIAVSKTRRHEEIQVLYDLGQRLFGENRIAELNQKADVLPKDIKWHLIGPLQSKKVKLCRANIALIHSLDRPKIIRALNKRYKSLNEVVDGLLQFNISKEEAKHGFSLETALEFLNSDLDQLTHIRITGVMGMAELTDNLIKRQAQFNALKEIHETIKSTHFPECDFDIISMGMSGDYMEAIECGSTMVRVGTLLFGPRSI